MKSKKLIPLLIFLYGLWFFALAASYIYQSNKHITLKFQVAGTGFIAPKLPNVFKVWASHDEKNFDFSQFHIAYTLLCQTDLSNELSAQSPLSQSGEATLTIAAPQNDCSSYFLTFSLLDEQEETIKSAELRIEHSPEPSFKTLPKDKPLFFDSQQLNPFFHGTQSQIIIALFQNAAPLNQTIPLALKYGGGVIPQSVQPNRFGLVSLKPAIVSEVDLELSIPTAPSQSTQRYISLSLLGSNLQILTPKLPIAQDHTPLALRFLTMGAPTPVYCDIFYKNAWIQSETLPPTPQTQSLSILPTLFQTPQILSLSCCLSSWACNTNANNKNFIYSPTPISLLDATSLALNELQTYSPTHPLPLFIQQNPQVLSQAPEDELTLLLDYLLAALPPQFQQPKILLNTATLDNTRLNTDKQTHKFHANILFALTLLIGALILLTLYLKARREKAAIYLDAPPHKPRPDYSLVGAIFCVILLVLGFFYLFQII